MLSPTQMFAAFKVGGMADRAALSKSGLTQQINGLFKHNRAWVTCTSPTNPHDLMREGGSDHVLYFPAQPGLERVESHLFTRDQGSLYMLSLDHGKKEFQLSESSPAGTNPLVTMTPTLVTYQDEEADSLRLLHRVLASKTLGAVGEKPQTWQNIMPGFPADLKTRRPSRSPRTPG